MPADDGNLTPSGKLGQTSAESGDNFFLPAPQDIDVDGGLQKMNAPRFHLARLRQYASHVQQSL